MKLAILILLLSFFASYLEGQTACKYNGSSSAIVSELSRRNTNTGKHKLNQQELQKIAGYWVADCKCKRGVETREEAEKLYNDAFTSRQIAAYQDGENYKKDLSVFGDLEPPLYNYYSDKNVNHLFNNFQELKFVIKRYDELSEENKDKIEVVSKQTIIEGPTSFREAAISFAAADINPKAKYFYQLGEYHEEINSVVTLSYLLMSKNMDATFFDDRKRAKLEKVQRNVALEMKEAILKNDHKYIKSFLKTGLFNEVDFEGQDLLTYAIRQDQPDAVQLIMNNRVEGQPQNEINELLKKAMLKSAYFDSAESFKRFTELGVSSDFTLNGDSPLTVAQRYDSKEILSAIENK